MANYSVLKAAVQAVVKTNGNQEITGANMQSTLISIINSLGTGYQFMGVATPSTSPGTPDYNVAYIGGAGTYANFGTSVTVPVGSIGVFKYNGSWVKEQIALFAGIDDVPTIGSNNLVKSGGVYTQVLNLDEKIEYLKDKSIGGNESIITTVENAWSTAYYFNVTAGITYKIKKNCLGQLILATMSQGGNHVAENEYQRITLTGGVNGVTDFVCTHSANFICLYSGGDVPTGTIIEITPTGTLKDEFDEYVLQNNDNVEAVRVGISSLFNSPLLHGGAFSVIGDSISTFNKTGYYYPSYIQYYPYGDITDISQVYWYRLFNSLGSSSIVNVSYSGSTVTNLNPYPNFYERAQLVGASDICVVALGEYSYDTPVSSLNEEEFIPAYIKGIKTLLSANGSMQIICLALKMGQAYRNAIKNIARHYNLFFVDCSDYATIDGLHPNANGMISIYKAICRCFQKIEMPFRSDKNKLISTEKIPYQFIHNTNKTQSQHFCLGGDEYIIAQNTWSGEIQTRMGGYAWWLTNGRVSKYMSFNVDDESYKIVIPTWANMTNYWTGGLIVAGQHMYHQNWLIGVLDGYTGEIKETYIPPFAFKSFEANRTEVYVPFSYSFLANHTYTIVNNTHDNVIIRISTSYAQPYDTYTVLDTDGNMCKHTIVNYGETYTFTPATDAAYVMAYTAVNQGSVKTDISVIADVTDNNAITAMCVYEMPSSLDMRLFIASDSERKIYNIVARDGSDVRIYEYPSDVNNICALCFDEFGILYVAVNDIALCPNDGNTIYAYRVSPFISMEKIGTITIPRKADGGMSIKNGILYTYDNRTATINKISLGGLAWAYNNTPSYHIPISKLFNKIGMAVSGGAGEANVYYDEGKFKMWFSRGSIAYCESYDGISFDSPINVINNASRSHVFKHENIWHIYYILTDNSANKFKVMYHSTSSDGVTWQSPVQVMSASDVATACANTVWSDFQQFGSMYVGYIGGKWRMLFEGKTESDNTWSIGYAESSDMNNWVIDANNPQTKNHMSFGTSKGMRMIGRPKIFYYDAERGVWWLTCHYSQYLDIPTRIGIAWTKDFKKIYLAPSSPLLDFSNIEETDQLADAWLMEHDGELFLYNSCVRNYATQHSYIQVSKLSMTLKELIELVDVIELS